MCETWDSEPFDNVFPTYQEISSRRFGVELETSECDGYEDIQDSTSWACKRDCSIDGMEFISPVLWGDQGLLAVKSFCRLAGDWTTNRTCGYHLHLDMTGELWRNLQSIAYAYLRTYRIWTRLVNERRADNPMCGEPAYASHDIHNILSFDDWHYFVGTRDRFEFVNWRAWFVHKTLEVRLHEGTLNPTTIINWIKMHSRFVDTVRLLDLSDIDDAFGGNHYNQWKAMTDIVGSELSDFYRGRAESYGHSMTRVGVTI
jgi:hypothetical protein